MIFTPICSTHCALQHFGDLVNPSARTDSGHYTDTTPKLRLALKYDANEIGLCIRDLFAQCLNLQNTE